MNPILAAASTQQIEWTSKEAKDLRDFLESETGTKMLTLLLRQAPSLLDGSDVNKTLVTSGERKGYDILLDFVVSLTVEPPTENNESPNYPPLDDDSKWNDGEPKK